MKKFLLIFFCFLLVSVSSGCAPKSISADHYALDTIISITLYNTQDSAILQQCWDRVDELESLLSRTRPGSDIFRINHAGGKPVDVADETVELLTLALDIARASNGALDISVGRVTELWDFKAAAPSLPADEDLSAAVALVDYQKIQLDGNQVTIPAGMALDLGAIAKGFIADEVIKVLDKAGCSCALLNLGGNVLTHGTKKDGTSWSIGIRDPNRAASQALLSITFNGSRSVVTSGIYERGFDLHGIRYHHLIDPSTGMPADNDLMSVSIVAPSSAVADGLSTACFVLGSDKGIALLEQYENTEGLFLMKDGTQIMTSGFRSLIRP